MRRETSPCIGSGEEGRQDKPTNSNHFASIIPPAVPLVKSSNCYFYQRVVTNLNHQPRKRGVAYNEEELKVIWDARENNQPPIPWLQLQDKYGFTRDAAKRAYARMKANGGVVESAPAAPEPPPTAAPLPPDWMTAFAEWAKLNNLPVGNLPITATPTIQPIIQSPALFTPTKFSKVAFISDVHIPHHDKVSVRVMLNYLAEYKPDLILLGGDVFDFYLISDYDRDPGRQNTLQDEFDAGRDFMKAVDSLSPNVAFLLGNHEGRLMKLIAKNPGLFKLRSLDFHKAAELPERWACYPSQTHYEIGHLTALHGDLKELKSGGVNPSRTMFAKLKRSNIYGHFHRFSTHFDTNFDGTVRGAFGNGHLSDLKQVTYMRAPDWQTGFSTIELSSDAKLFAVRQHIIVDGRFVADGQEWSL